MPGSCSFRDVWFQNQKYVTWLKRSPSPQKAYCKLCYKDIDVSKMGEAALQSHMKGKKHSDLIHTIQTQSSSIHTYAIQSSDIQPGTFVGNNQIASTSNTLDTERRQSQPTVLSSLQSYISKQTVLSAEIIWTLKVIKSHYSFKSCDDVSDLFKLMFSDSDVVKSFSCGETKTAYLATFGIAPHFLSLLKMKIKSQKFYVIMFDESLNSELQASQLDVYVRIWDAYQVRSRYYGSFMMGHHTADDVYERFEEVCGEIGFSALVQLSMDGPRVNWKLHGLIQKTVEDQNGKKLLNTGSCGLHILHNAFRDGNTATKWEIDNKFVCMKWLFKDSPARREDYMSITGCNLFPKDFCGHRWLENVGVAERVLEMLPNMTKYVKAAKEGKVTKPNNKSFQTVEEALNDKLFPAKVNFFLMIARSVHPFLEKYQTDKPMLPFVTNDLGILIKSLMERFIKPEIMTGATTPVKLLKISVGETDNHVHVSKIDIGFVAENDLKRLEKEKKASELQIRTFREDCRLFLVKMVSKLLEKSPLNYPLVRYVNVFDPRIFLSDKERSREKLKRLLRILCDSQRIEEVRCEDVLSQFNEFFDLVLRDNSDDFGDFEPDRERLDTFYYEFMHENHQYKDLWEIIQMIMILSHGQASVERGFSVNKQISVYNIQEKCLSAQRVIIDHINAVGGITEVSVSKDLLGYASSARQKYHLYLEEKRKEKINDVRNEKKRSLQEEISTIKSKKKRFEKDKIELENDANKYALEAESKGRLTLIAKSNSLRKSAEKKASDISKLEIELGKKLEELKSLD